MPHLLSVWPSVARRIRDAGTALLLFDFDGTLVPIVDRPELAVLAPETRQRLANLAERENFITGIISGRSLPDVSTKVDAPGLVYVGNHGLEMAGCGISFSHPQARQVRETLARVCDKLGEALSVLPGTIIEDKGLTLSVHYRLVSESEQATVRQRFDDVLLPYTKSGQLRTTAGKMVLEVRPNVDWGKGKAITELQRMFPDAGLKLRTSPHTSVPVGRRVEGPPLTLFFGDDVTDEDGFAAVQETDGVAVFVGAARQPTSALHRVDSPAEVSHALELLEQL